MRFPVLALTAFLLAPHSESLAGALTLTAPLDYQVIQRESLDQGRIVIRGQLEHAQLKDLVVEARILASRKANPWHRLEPTFIGPVFEATMQAPAGGWHRLEVRALLGDQVLADAAIEHIGIGEIFVVAGQSNSANHGEEKQRTQTGRVATFDGQHWQLANDPQPGASGNGGSFLPPFGDAMAEHLNVPVGFIACGIGATSVREWLPRGTPFPNPPTLTSRVQQLPGGGWESKGDAFEMFVGRLKALGPHGFRAVLWHQGESDANQQDSTRTLPGDLYRDQLERIIRESRREIGWDAPWFVAQVSYHAPGDEASSDIRAAQASLWKDGIALEGPDSDMIKGDLRENGGRGVHFSGAGLREHAARWVEKVVPWLEQQITSLPNASLILDLDADRGVTVEDGDRVSLWQNQVARFAGRDFVSRDEGRTEPGSGRPTLRSSIKELNGHNALEFRQQELVCMDEDAFDPLTQGHGCTWVAVLAVFEQRVGLEDVNSFFGNLRNGGNYEGLWGCLRDDNTLWWGARNGITFGRFDANNPQLLGPKLATGNFAIVAGRMAAGVDTVKLDIFVNNAVPVASTEVPVNPKANPSKMAVGQERDATNHPGHESFDGEIARFLIFDRPLDNAELAAVFSPLRARYGIK